MLLGNASVLGADVVESDRYLSKIVFTYILGYQVDVGHMEAVNLISSPKYSEKQIVREPTLLQCRYKRRQS